MDTDVSPSEPPTPPPLPPPSPPRNRSLMRRRVQPQSPPSLTSAASTATDAPTLQAIVMLGVRRLTRCAFQVCAWISLHVLAVCIFVVATFNRQTPATKQLIHVFSCLGFIALIQALSLYARDSRYSVPTTMTTTIHHDATTGVYHHCFALHANDSQLHCRDLVGIPPGLFALFWPGRVPEASHEFHCDDWTTTTTTAISGAEHGQLCPEHPLTPALRASVDEARRRTGLGEIRTLANLKYHAEQVLRAIPQWSCVCAPMFGILYQHVVIRVPTANGDHFNHLYNPHLSSSSSPSTTVNVTDNHSFFLYDAKPVERVRQQRVSVTYMDENTCNERRATVTGTMALCLQMCVDLFQ